MPKTQEVARALGTKALEKSLKEEKKFANPRGEFTKQKKNLEDFAEAFSWKNNCPTTDGESRAYHMSGLRQSQTRDKTAITKKMQLTTVVKNSGLESVLAEANDLTFELNLLAASAPDDQDRSCTAPWTRSSSLGSSLNSSRVQRRGWHIDLLSQDHVRTTVFGYGRQLRQQRSTALSTHKCSPGQKFPLC
jgi:hypothetical protein